MTPTASTAAPDDDPAVRRATPARSPRMLDLCGRIAPITGSGAGIGFGIARAFGHASANLVIDGRRPQRPAGALLARPGAVARL